jgi:methyl-accepting chemotaxis protein
MTEIVDSIRHVTDIMGNIANASSQQTEGIARVNQAITEMNHATQQNAALVEQAAAAAQSLQDQAAQLEDVVSIFKTGA